MCNFSDVVETCAEERGFARGFERAYEKSFEKSVTRTYLKNIQNIMQSLNYSALDAMALLGIPDDEHQKYLDLLRQ